MEKENCIFCKISKGEIVSNKVYEDAEFFAFLDNQPVADGHILIIPKKHTVWMHETDDETISKIFILTKKLMLAIKKALSCDYIIETVAGNEVPHFHIHLIPRYYNDNLPEFPRKKYENSNESELAKKINEAF